jgi:hypothetical protein
MASNDTSCVAKPLELHDLGRSQGAMSSAEARSFVSEVGKGWLKNLKGRNLLRRQSYTVGHSPPQAIHHRNHWILHISYKLSRSNLTATLLCPFLIIILPCLSPRNPLLTVQSEKLKTFLYIGCTSPVSTTIYSSLDHPCH